MDIWSQDKLIIFVLFVVPGFIAIKIYELFSAIKEKDTGKQLIDAVSYSCLTYAIMFIPLSYVETPAFRTHNPNWYISIYFCVLFVVPIILALILRWLRHTNWVQKFLPHPTLRPWDFVFSQRLTYWVRVTLKSGKVIGGMFGLNSFASSAPAEEQIYLEQYWILNDDEGFDRAVEQTAGIIILASEIATVELIYSGNKEGESDE